MIEGIAWRDSACSVGKRIHWEIVCPWENNLYSGNVACTVERRLHCGKQTVLREIAGLLFTAALYTVPEPIKMR